MKLEPIQSEARLLIVDDEPANVVLLQYILRHAGYENLRTTTDPRQAMTLFEEQKPDLILLDLMMPHLSGFEIMGLLGEKVSPSDCLPILVLTADVTPETKHQALQVGASDFLTKPFDHVEVLLRIRHLLQIRSQHQQLSNHNDRLEETVTARTSELRQANTRLEETLVELRATQQQIIQHERMSALGTMAAGLAHDLNNSLSLILGYSELLQHDLADVAYRGQSDDFLGTIITAAQDASGMFDRLRTFYRASEAQDQRRGLDLNALVEQAVSLTRSRWHGQAVAQGVTIQVTLEIAPDLPALQADAIELRELLTNLIFNAVDAMPQGGTLTLRTRHDPATPGEPETLLLEVADTGVGMDDETSRRCLEPFFTTKGARGTGLGLAMVYGTVQRHEGTIQLTSRVGEGTCFSLRFPLLTCGITIPEEERRVSPSLRVLVVDDQPVFAEILRRKLADDGHEVVTAGDGTDALQKFRSAGRAGFQLVITDQVMPGMTGENLAAALKTLDPTVRVILFSGSGEMDGTKHAKHSAVDLLMAKPTTQEVLRAAVSQAIAQPSPSDQIRSQSESAASSQPTPIPVIQSRMRLTKRAA